MGSILRHRQLGFKHMLALRDEAGNNEPNKCLRIEEVVRSSTRPTLRDTAENENATVSFEVRMTDPHDGR